MIGKILGGQIEGKKIILEAGHVETCRNIPRAQGHHGDRATGKIRAIAFVSKPYTSVSARPTKI